jgi:hypothetical protein
MIRLSPATFTSAERSATWALAIPFHVVTECNTRSLRERPPGSAAFRIRTRQGARKRPWPAAFKGAPRNLSIAPRFLYPPGDSQACSESAYVLAAACLGEVAPQPMDRPNPWLPTSQAAPFQLHVEPSKSCINLPRKSGDMYYITR